MSAYEEKPSFDKLLEVLREEIGCDLDIDAETIKIVSEIKDHEKAKHFTMEQWDNLITNAIDDENYFVIMAMIHSEDFPERGMWRLFDELDDTIPLLTSDYIKEDLIYEIFSMYNDEFYDILIDQGLDFSDTVLDFLCFELSDKELEEDLKYKPFEFLSKDSKRLPELVDLLNNTDMHIPESLTMAVADNLRLPDAVRNKAFDRGYNPLQSNNHTEYIKTELYKVYADTVFDINPENAEEEVMAIEAKSRLMDFARNNRLPESCQIDLIQRCGKDKYYNDIAFEIIKHTKYSSVLSTAQKVLDDTRLSEKIISNPTAIGNSVMEKLLSDIYPQNLQHPFIEAIFHHPFSEDIVNAFINLDNVDVKRAIVCSYESSANQVDSVLHDSWEKPYYRELLYLKELRNVCVNFVHENNIQKIISTGLLEMINDEKNPTLKFSKTCSTLRDSIKKQKSTHWSNVYNNDRMVLTNVLSMMYKNYPEFQHITKKLQEKVNRTYNITQLSHKYTDIFICNNSRQEQDVPFNMFNIPKFLDMSETQKKEFINDIKNINDIALSEKIMDDIELFCDDAVCYQDSVALAVGGCGELYNVVYNIAQSAIYKCKEEKEMSSPNESYTSR